MSKNFELLQRLGTNIGEFASANEQSLAAAVQPVRTSSLPVSRHLAASIGDGEPMRELLQRLFLTNPKGPRVVIFTPAESAAPSSNICAHASELLAKSTSANVCVVNANFQDDSLHRYFEDADGPGLRESLSEPHPLEHYLVPLDHEHLFLLRSGARGSKGTPVAMREDWTQRFVQLRAKFDYVLLDAPPLTSSPEALMMAQLADGVVVVVEANATRRENAFNLRDRLQAAKVNILGTVLNNRTFPIPNEIYNRL